MFYAAAEIIFWILLAAVVGGGIGYGFSEARLLRLNKRLDASKANAPMERELAIAWDTIEDLNRRLQVAHETIRETTTEPGDEPMETAVAPVAAVEAAGDDIVGSRLSQRVASASAANQADKADALD